MADVQADLKQRAAKIAGLQADLKRSQETTKELKGDIRYEAKKLNKLIAEYPEAALAAEVKAIPLGKEKAEGEGDKAATE